MVRFIQNLLDMNELISMVYPEKMTFFPFGDAHIVGFLGETVVENWTQPGAPEDAPAITGYQYTGPRSDGGTLMPCDNPGDYGSVVNAIIRSKYTLSEELAIQRHYINSFEGHEAEWQAYNDFCEAAKLLAKSWLGLS